MVVDSSDLARARQYLYECDRFPKVTDRFRKTHHPFYFRACGAKIFLPWQQECQPGEVVNIQTG